MEKIFFKTPEASSFIEYRGVDLFSSVFIKISSTGETSFVLGGSGEIKSRYVGQNKRIAPIKIKPMSVF